MNLVLGEPLQNRGTLKPGMESIMFFKTVDGENRLWSFSYGGGDHYEKHILEVIESGAHLLVDPNADRNMD